MRIPDCHPERKHEAKGLCSPCYSKKWKETHPEERLAQARRHNKRRYDRFREWLDDLKSKPCQDCGGTFPPECMQFDHVRDKKFGIAKRAGWMARKDELLEEIAKCELVCANCHAIRTRRRANAGRSGTRR